MSANTFLVFILLWAPTHSAANPPFWASWSIRSRDGRPGGNSERNYQHDHKRPVQETSHDEKGARPRTAFSSYHPRFRSPDHPSVSSTPLDVDSLDVLAASGRGPSKILLDQARGHASSAVDQTLPECPLEAAHSIKAENGPLEHGSSVGDYSFGLKQSLSTSGPDASSRQLAFQKGVVPLDQLQERSQGGGRTCWLAAYLDLMGSCREVLSNDTRKSELSLGLANCFLEASGRPPVACARSMHGGGQAAMENCLRSLSDHEHSIYLAFFIDCPNMCHYLQSNMFKQEIESTVNNLKSTATWLEQELEDMSSFSKDILETAKASLIAHQLAQLRQEEALRELQRVQAGVAGLQGSVESAGASQKEMAEGIFHGLKDLDEGSKSLGLAMEKSLAKQADIVALQEATAVSLQVLKAEQLALVEQHKADLHELFHLAWEHQEKSAQWHALMEEMQGRVLAGQGAAADEMRRATAEQLMAAQHQSAVMGELAARTVGFHGDAVRWQEEVQRAQGEVLMGQERVAKGVAAVARDAETHHRHEAEWNLRMEQLQMQQAERAREMLRVQDEFAKKHGDMMGRMEGMLAILMAVWTETRLMWMATFYGAASAATFFATTFQRTAAARMPMFTVLVLAAVVEWHLRSSLGAPHSGPEASAGTDASTPLQVSEPGLLLMCRWGYTVVALAILLSHAFTYRDLAVASHMLLQRQSQHFQTLILALQEVAQNFRHDQEQQQQQQQHHVLHRQQLGTGTGQREQAAGESLVPASPPHLVQFPESASAAAEARRSRVEHPGVQQQLRSGSAAFWSSPVTDGGDEEGEDYADEGGEEVEEGEEANSPFASAPQGSSQGATCFMSAGPGNQVPNQSRNSAAANARPAVQSVSHPSSAFSRMEVRGPGSRVPVAAGSFDSPVRGVESGCSGVGRVPGMDLCPRRSPRIEEMRQRLEAAQQQHQLQPPHGAATGMHRTSAARAARLAVRRAVSYSRMRWLGSGLSEGYEEGSGTTSSQHGAALSWLSQAEVEEEDHTVDPDYVPASFTGSMVCRTYNLRPRPSQGSS